MPTEINWEPGGVVCHFTGVVSSEEIWKMKSEILDDPRIGDINFQIADFLMLEKFEFSAEIVRDIAGLDQDLTIANPEMKVALITSDSYMRGLLDLYTMTHQSMGGKWLLEAFDDEEEARAWAMSLT
jgi:hypothetical protein